MVIGYHWPGWYAIAPGLPVYAGAARVPRTFRQRRLSCCENQKGVAMKPAWDLFDAEVGQLDALWKYFQALKHNAQPAEVRQAVVESAVIHLRIIMEMVSRDAPQKADDYCLADLIALADRPAGLPALVQMYSDDATYAPLVMALLGGTPAANLTRSPKWQIDKLMFHPTKNRAVGHDWTPILNILAPHVGPVIQDLRRHAVR